MTLPDWDSVYFQKKCEVIPAFTIYPLNRLRASLLLDRSCKSHEIHKGKMHYMLNRFFRGEYGVVPKKNRLWNCFDVVA